MYDPVSIGIGICIGMGICAIFKCLYVCCC